MIEDKKKEKIPDVVDTACLSRDETTSVIAALGVAGSGVKSLSQSWRNLISYVPQVIYLSDKSILENIIFSDKNNEVDENLLIEVTKAAQLDEFIKSLKDGFNTIVGERGVRLSGGQKQRLGIARALYNKKPILILDEATSALDLETEEKLMKKIYSLNPRPTIILVAHRLSTLYACDKVIDLS